MPGYVMHLAVAERIIKLCNINCDEVANSIRIGSIIPDTKKGDNKKESHFWTDDNFKEFVRIPSVEDFLKKYSTKLSNPYVFGVYAHLYLDYIFVSEYWKKHFSFMDNNMREATLFNEVDMVKMLQEDRVVTRKEFFSSEMYYGDYDRLNSYIISKYNIKAPELTEQIKQDSTIIEEISLNDVEDILNNMITFTGESDKNTSYPQTKVFNLEELEALIEEVSRSLVIVYKANN